MHGSQSQLSCSLTMCVWPTFQNNTLFFFFVLILFHACIWVLALAREAGQIHRFASPSTSSHSQDSLYRLFFFHQRIFVNFQPCCILAIVRIEETGACGITQVLSQNWRDANGSFVGPARPGFSSLFNVFCTHSHESSHFPRHPTDALLPFFLSF